MEVDINSPAATSEYRGVTYYFCDPGCKVRFDSNPDRFLGITTQEKKDEKPRGLRRFFKR